MRDNRHLVMAAMLVAASVAAPALADLDEYRLAVQSETSLVSYYTFDGDSTAVADTEGTNHGTLAGSGAAFTAPEEALGGQGQALSLNGSSWVTFGQVAAFAFGTNAANVPGTIEMWVRPLAPAGGYDPVIAGVRNGNDTRWSLHIQQARNGLGVWAGGAGWHPAAFDFTRPQWYHVVFQFAPQYGAAWMYVNGIWVGDFWGGALGSGTNLPFQLGSSSPTGQEVFNGLIDEVAIYSDTLSDATIAQHYQAIAGTGFGPATPSLSIRTSYEGAIMGEPSLLSFWSFEGDDAIAEDKKGSVDGTLVAPTYWTSGFAGGQALGLGLEQTGYVFMGPVPAFKFPGGSGTVEAWISPMPDVKYRDANAGRMGVLACADDFDNTYYGMEVRTSDQTAVVEVLSSLAPPVTTKEYATIPGGLASTEKWDHLAAVFDAGQTRLYINGRKVIDRALPLLDYAGFLGNFQIGAIDPDGDWPFIGKIDEVAVYGAALTSEQVAAHYASAAITFSIEEHTFTNPSDMTPVNFTLNAPTGQSSPAGLELTFTYDTAVIQVTATLPDPIGTVNVPSGTPLTIPVGGLTSVPMTVSPVNGGFGSTKLTVSADAASGWVYGDSVDFSVLLADQGLILVDDHFDDNILGTNTGKPGGGFWQFFNGTTHTEENSAWNLSLGGYDWSSGGIYSKSAGTFKFLTEQGIRIEWVISNVALTANGSSGFPGGSTADCRHELAVISANRNNSQNLWDHELFRNTGGGFYVNLYYSGGSYPTQNINVTGSIRAVNLSHPNECDGEWCAGLETPVTFALDPTTINSITPQKPLVVTLELDQSGWKVGFSQEANPVYTILPNHPGVSVETATNKITGGWDSASFSDAAFGTEFMNGGFLWALFQNVSGGRGSGSIDRVKACVGCTLVTDCPNPFADSDGDGDVDMDDFGFFQQCFTGNDGGVPDGCRCLDHNNSGGIEVGDFTSFLNCASGADVPAIKTCDD